MSSMSKADEIRADVVELMMVLVDLADYSKDDLLDIVDEAIERSA